jgi:hypothetical protein
MELCVNASHHFAELLMGACPASGAERPPDPLTTIGAIGVERAVALIRTEHSASRAKEGARLEMPFE